MPKDKLVTIEFEMTEEQAYESAQFFKRLSWRDIRGCATSDNNAYCISHKISIIRDAINNKGFNPR